MRVAVSVVSHGHGPMVQRLLDQLARYCAATVTQVIVTHNVAEPPLQGRTWPFEVTLVQPTQPLGYSANHNAAFKHCKADFFCVLNPDIDLLGADPFPDLCRQAGQAATGLAYPRQLNEAGDVLDFQRETPTPWALLRRYTLGTPEARVDWVNGAFMLFPSGVFRRLGGFDSTFHMYCEDVDVCLRLRRQGLALRPAGVDVLHLTRRSSHRNARHLVWHVTSLLRLWCSRPFWWAVLSGSRQLRQPH